jgi:hypothetical protein
MQRLHRGTGYLADEDRTPCGVCTCSGRIRHGRSIQRVALVPSRLFVCPAVGGYRKVSMVVLVMRANALSWAGIMLECHYNP